MQNAPLGAFCNTFDLHEEIIGLENQFVVFLRVAVLDRFYCIGDHRNHRMDLIHYMGFVAQNLSSGFLTKGDSSQSPQLHRLARKLKFHLQQV